MFASQEGPAKRGPQLDYEKHRRPGGMRIEARNLGLSYDGVTPTLHDINITVEPGESLAVVGFNGRWGTAVAQADVSGKTTLVRALLGLHSHTGTLLVNGIPFEDFDAVTLHTRMSCLFQVRPSSLLPSLPYQDYDRYDLSVRQNVGFGDTDKMVRWEGYCFLVSTR
jgi:ABC-type multidrug transport system fused ATPase/permease subunit